MNNEIVLEILRRHFGEDASIKRRFFGGYHITTIREEEADFTGKIFKNIIGGADIYRAIVGASEELWGSVSAWGPATHVLTTMAHADELGIIVHPQADSGSTGCLKFVASFTLYLISTAIACLYEPASRATVIGLIATFAIMKAINPAWNRAAL